MRCLTHDAVTSDDVEAHKVFWDFEDDHISRWISEFLMAYWIDVEWGKAVSLTIENALYEFRQLLTPLRRNMGGV